jgi:Glyoxalase-like domain
MEPAMPTPVQQAQNRQVPEAGQMFLDHVGWFVPDMDVAARAFEKLGFNLTPYSVHGDRDAATGELKPLGTANRLVMLEEAYLEILTLHGGVTNPSVERMKTSMARHVGVHLIAMTVADSLAEAKRLEKDGFALNPTINLRRQIEAQDGSQVEVAFTVIRPMEGVHPEGRIQVLTQHTPEHMWQPRYVKNDNAISGLRGVMLVVDDPAEVEARLARFTARQVTARPDHTLIKLDRGHLRIFKATEARAYLGGLKVPAAPCMAALGFVSRDLDRTRAFLKGRGVKLAEDGASRIIVDASDGVGAYLIIS